VTCYYYYQGKGRLGENFLINTFFQNLILRSESESVVSGMQETKIAGEHRSQTLFKRYTLLKLTALAGSDISIGNRMNASAINDLHNEQSSLGKCSFKEFSNIASSVDP